VSFLLYVAEAVTCLPPSNVLVLDRCINRAVFRMFGIAGDKETLWQLRQFLGLYSVQQMVVNKGNLLVGSDS